MLEVRGVVAPGREDDVEAAGVHVVEDAAQALAVVAVVRDGRSAEGLGVAAAAELARHERVRSPRRDAQVVLEDEPLVALALDEVDAADVAVDAARRDDPLALGQVAGAREGEILGHDAVADDLLGAVDVGEVGVEGVDALREAALKGCPDVLLYDAGYGVEGEEPLVELAVLVQAELHAVARELLVDLRRVRKQALVHGGIGWHRPPLSVVVLGSGRAWPYGARRVFRAAGEGVSAE